MDLQHLAAMSMTSYRRWFRVGPMTLWWCLIIRFITWERSNSFKHNTQDLDVYKSSAINMDLDPLRVQAPLLWNPLKIRGIPHGAATNGALSQMQLHRSWDWHETAYDDYVLYFANFTVSNPVSSPISTSNLPLQNIWRFTSTLWSSFSLAHWPHEINVRAPGMVTSEVEVGLQTVLSNCGASNEKSEARLVWAAPKQTLSTDRLESVATTINQSDQCKPFDSASRPPPVDPALLWATTSARPLCKHWTPHCGWWRCRCCRRCSAQSVPAPQPASTAEPRAVDFGYGGYGMVSFWGIVCGQSLGLGLDNDNWWNT